MGVMGTDIPIQEITNLVPKGKLGANAYTFMYTHHGYVLFHPNMKPMYHKIVSRVPFNWLRKLSFSETHGDAVSHKRIQDNV